jgi:putative ABC transport system permease protein
VTALLVRGVSYGDVARLSGALSRRGDVQAIFPGRVMNQLLAYLNAGRTALAAVSAVAAAVAFIMVLIAILAASLDRRRQIATLRAIGASRADIVALLMAEAALIAGAGAVAGVAIGKGAALLLASRVEQAGAPPLGGPTLDASDLVIALAAVALALAAGAIPAWLACRQDVARNLAADS